MTQTESTPVNSEIKSRWRLEDIFPGLDEFHAGLRETESDIENLARFRTHLGENPARLADALEELFELSRKFHALHGWASMQSDQDTRVAGNQALKQRVEMLWTDYSRATSWVRPELLELGDALLEWPSLESRLVPFEQHMREVHRAAPHVLSPPEERIMAEAGLLTGFAGSLFSLFQNAELPRPEVKLSTGDTVRLTPAEFSKQRRSTIRKDRERVFESYFDRIGDYRETLGANLNQGVKAHVFSARSRHHQNCLAAALHSENIPQSVYHNLIEQVREALPLLHRYLNLRRRVLDVDTLCYHDLYCPLSSDAEEPIDHEKAKSLVYDSLQPLGDEYRNTLRKALDDRWIDWYPREGKRSGAYSSGAAYDVHPFILLNYTGDFDSVSTLTHELGHTMHSYFSNKTQPFAKSHYSIFNAEVASTFNEALLLRRSLEEASEAREKIHLLRHALDGLRGTLFRQTQFAEFELAIHRRVEEGVPLTGESLDALYLEQLHDYLGHAEGTCRVSDAYGVEWATVPHFYYNFYVYQYATGIVAATALSEAVLSGETNARVRYLNFLCSGGSQDSLDLLRTAGVDLTKPEPYQATFRAMGGMLDELEALLDG